MEEFVVITDQFIKTNRKFKKKKQKRVKNAKISKKYLGTKQMKGRCLETEQLCIFRSYFEHNRCSTDRVSLK